MKKILSLILLNSVLFTQVYAINSVEARNQSMHTRTPEQKLFQHQLATVWAPMVFADSTIAKVKKNDGQEIEIMDSADAMMAVDSDGDLEIANNRASFALRKADGTLKDSVPAPRASMLSFVQESKHFYYITYTKYNIWDTFSKHSGDTEYTWTVIEKDGSKYGKLVLAATNAHGYAKIYAHDKDLEAKYRANYVKNSIMGGNWIEQAKAASYMGEPFASDHDDNKKGRAEWVVDAEGVERGLMVFSCRGGHGMYKCNSKLWEKGEGAGYIYVVKSEQGMPSTIQLMPIAPMTKRVLGYELVDQDDLISKYYPENFDQLSDEQKAPLLKVRSTLFDPVKGDGQIEKVADGVIERDLSLPAAFAHEPGEKKAEANLAYDHWMKFEGKTLSIPHSIHRLIDPDSASKIDGDYIYNLYAKYTSL